MSIMLVDAAMAAKLDQADGSLQICTRDGRVLGYFSPAKAKTLRLDPPVSIDELRRRESEPGRPLSEILAELENPA